MNAALRRLSEADSAACDRPQCIEDAIDASRCIPVLHTPASDLSVARRVPIITFGWLPQSERRDAFRRGVYGATYVMRHAAVDLTLTNCNSEGSFYRLSPADGVVAAQPKNAGYCDRFSEVLSEVQRQLDEGRYWINQVPGRWVEYRFEDGPLTLAGTRSEPPSVIRQP